MPWWWKRSSIASTGAAVPICPSSETNGGWNATCLYETGDGIGAIEVKAGATIASDYFRALKRVAKVLPRISGKAVVYGGADRQFRRDADVAPLADLPKVLERLDGHGN